MRVEGRNGAIDIVGSTASIRAALPRASYRVAGRPADLAPSRLDGPDGGPWTASDGIVRLTLSTRPAPSPAPPGGVLLRLTVTVIGDRQVRLDDATLFEVGGPAGLELGAGPDDWSLYRNGWNSWANAGAVRMHESDPDPWLFAIRDTTVDPGTPRSGEPGRFRSELVAGLADRAGTGGLVLGFVGGTHCLSVIDLDVTSVRSSRSAAGGDRHLRRLAATCHLDGITAQPGDTVATEDLLIADGEDPVGLLEAWAAAFGALQQARVPARPPSGWCSWYYHYSKVTEVDVRRALDAAETVAKDVPLGYVMIDDGHQSAIGDWLTTNEKFPSGMAGLATDIRATGRDAGIWIAPFIVDRRSEVARHHPGWLLRDDEGEPVNALWNPTWNRRHGQWTLDCTRQEVQEHLEATARTIRHAWGYRVIKLDFCFAAALPGARWNRAATRAEALRSGLDAIRRGAGDDAVLIGCGLPLGPAVGSVDAMRIGTDVAPTWGGRVMRWATSDQGGLSSRVAMRNTLSRAFLHGHLWSNDPDCVMVRTDRTRLTDAEVRFLVAAVALTDGMIVSSDRLDLVPPERLDLLRLAHELSGGRSRVTDLFAGPEPERVVATRSTEILWGHFHWGASPAAVTVELDGPEWERLGIDRPSEVREAFSGARLPVVGTRVELGLLDPHDARVLRIPRR